ncbi:hypothetical protein [Pectobacterium sp. B1J-3]|uniref:hypothetical protein n=1 Tax=Pectobacterium sp. B1J-3 TaxID=3385371 RepID=UPI00390644E9
MSKSRVVVTFLMPTLVLCFMAFLYTFFEGVDGERKSFLNSWDFVALVIISGHFFICFFASILLYSVMKKYFLVIMAVIIYLFTITTIDFDYVDSFLFSAIQFTIPASGVFILKRFNKSCMELKNNEN